MAGPQETTAVTPEIIYVLCTDRLEKAAHQAKQAAAAGTSANSLGRLRDAMSEAWTSTDVERTIKIASTADGAAEVATYFAGLLTQAHAEKAASLGKAEPAAPTGRAAPVNAVQELADSLR